MSFGDLISANLIVNWVRNGPYGQFWPKMTEKSQNYFYYLISILKYYEMSFRWKIHKNISVEIEISWLSSKNFAKFLVKMSLNGIKFDFESKILFVSLPKIGILDDLTDKLNFWNFSKSYPRTYSWMGLK